jgi:hypothetical protein
MSFEFIGKPMDETDITSSESFEIFSLFTLDKDLMLVNKSEHGRGLTTCYM